MSRLAAAAVLALGAALFTLPAYATQFTIVIEKLKFGTVPTELHVGDTILWQNNDVLRHSVTARDKSFDIDLPPKTEVTQVLGAAGTFAFFCKFHPGMTGTLVVQP
jgi:plastocyanin